MAKCLEGLEFVQLSKSGETGSMVMQVSYPHIIGTVVSIEQTKKDDIESFMRSLANGDNLAKVRGYSIFILPGGTLDRVVVAPDKMKSILERMAGYMLSDIIPGRENRFNKFSEGYKPRPRMDREEARHQKELREAHRAAKLAQDED